MFVHGRGQNKIHTEAKSEKKLFRSFDLIKARPLVRLLLMDHGPVVACHFIFFLKKVLWAKRGKRMARQKYRKIDVIDLNLRYNF